MKTKPIIADPLVFYRMGIRTLVDVAVLVHIGRCGLVGAVRSSMQEALRNTSYETVRTSTDRLEDLGLITCYSKSNGPGNQHRYVVTVKGWETLTTQADFTMFPDAAKALVKGGAQ